jgi:hypothetical protein
MVNAHYVIIDFRAKFFSKIQNQASDTSCSLPSFSSAPFLLRAVPSERLGQVYLNTCNYFTAIFIGTQIVDLLAKLLLLYFRYRKHPTISPPPNISPPPVYKPTTCTNAHLIPNISPPNISPPEYKPPEYKSPN